MKPARLDNPIDVRHEHPDPQKSHDVRTEFERDRSRILHAESFRRLQQKTQVFYGVQGASYRTRLTHSMEVALIAKALATKFGADPDLCEAVALAHDLGHPPFGHNGESVLNACMAGFGGFEGNAQTLRIVRTLEVKGHRYLGLNLTFATLDGILKYKTPYNVAAAERVERVGEDTDVRLLPKSFPQSDDARDLQPAPSAPKCVYDDDFAFVEAVSDARGTSGRESFECGVLNLADDIAYCVADLQDGLNMGFLSMPDLKVAADGGGFVQEVFGFLGARDAAWSLDEVRGLLTEFAELHARIAGKSNVSLGDDPENKRLAVSKELASKLHREFVAAVTLDGGGVPTMKRDKHRKIAVLKAVTRTQILKDVRLTTLDAASRKVVKRLFEAYANDPELLPRAIRARIRSDEFSDALKLRFVCDHLAAMSDEAALQAYRRLYEPGSQGLLDFV
ncbi:MAG: dGTPase [Bradymonadia bacterium]|jgi:dGTPase